MRLQQRTRVLRTGRILLEGGGTLDCVIRDISENGARLKLADAAPTPERFELLFVTMGTAHPVERRWQKGVDLGVQFVGPSRTVAP